MKVPPQVPVHSITKRCLLALGILAAPACFAAPPANDNFANRTVLSGLNLSGNGTLSESTSELGQPTFNGDIVYSSVWYRWSHTSAVRTELNILDLPDLKIIVCTGSTLGSLVKIAEGQGRVRFTALANTQYSILVGQSQGFTGDFEYSVTSAPPAPANDNFPGTTLAGLPLDVVGTTWGASQQVSEPPHRIYSFYQKQAHASIWYRWSPANSGRVELNTLASTNGTVIAVYTGSSLTSLTRVAGDDEVSTRGDYYDTLQSRVRFQAIAGTTYRIAVDTPGQDEGPVILRIQSVVQPPANDSIADATVVTDLPSAIAGSNIGASSEGNGESHYSEFLLGALPAVSSVWYKWVATTNGWMTADTFGSNFNTLLAVYTNNTFSSEIMDNNDYRTSKQSRVDFFATLGHTYYIAVDGQLGEEGAVSLHLSPSGVHPPIEITMSTPDPSIYMSWEGVPGRLYMILSGPRLDALRPEPGTYRAYNAGFASWFSSAPTNSPWFYQVQEANP